MEESTKYLFMMRHGKTDKHKKEGYVTQRKGDAGITPDGIE
jgi:hypothetical protein